MPGSGIHIVKIFRKLSGIFFLGAALIFVSSCAEDVVTVDLKNTTPKIVIEGTLSDQGEPCTVKITTSGDFYRPSDFPPVTGAMVTLRDSEGNEEYLNETKPGLYRGESILGVKGRTYTLIVTSGGKNYSASSTIMKPVEIDSVSYHYETDPDIYNEDYENKKEGYVFRCHFTDPEDTVDYYRIIIYLNSSPTDGIHLFNDRISNGKNIDYSFEEDYLFDPKDTLKVELLTLDKPSYNYFSTLNDLLQGQGENAMFSSVPDNPTSNLSNGALGYFSAYSVQSKTIVFK